MSKNKPASLSYIKLTGLHFYRFITQMILTDPMQLF